MKNLQKKAKYNTTINTKFDISREDDKLITYQGLSNTKHDLTHSFNTRSFNRKSIKDVDV